VHSTGVLEFRKAVCDELRGALLTAISISSLPICHVSKVKIRCRYPQLPSDLEKWADSAPTAVWDSGCLALAASPVLDGCLS
jgi:hypothetical protein